MATRDGGHSAHNPTVSKGGPVLRCNPGLQEAQPRQVSIWGTRDLLQKYEIDYDERYVWD